jgi:hypothetical protein
MERLEELRRRRIRFFSVKQGEQVPGIVFGIHAILDEEYVRNLARTVRPANLRSVKAGKHHGPVPFGYKRVWLAQAEGRPTTQTQTAPDEKTAWVVAQGQPKTQMVPDEQTAWIVTELFTRYDQGESIIELTQKPLVERALFDRVQVRLAERGPHAAGGRFAGGQRWALVFCSARSVGARCRATAPRIRPRVSFAAPGQTGGRRTARAGLFSCMSLTRRSWPR